MIMCVRNEERSLAAQLDALVAQDWSGAWELLVVDNGSTDSTAEIVQSYAARDARVRYVPAFEKASRPYAVDVGIASTTAEWLVFCDGDDVVADGWLHAMADGLARHEVVTGPNELDRLNPAWLADSRGRADADPTGSFYGIFPTVRGNNFGVRRETWVGLGPRPTDCFPVDDLELSMRCWLRGIEVVGLPGAAVHYRYRADRRALWRQGYGYGSKRPLLAKLLKEAGKPAPSAFAGWKSWVLLVARIPTLVTRTGRAQWSWVAGNRVGQLVGSIRYRTLLL